MKLIIAYPPLNYPIYPYPALYILAGLFKDTNVDVELLDLNVEFLKYILKRSNLKKSYNKILKIYKTSNGEHKKFLSKFIFKYKKLTKVVLKESDNYYDLYVNKYTSVAKYRRISYAIKLAFAPYYPTMITSKGIYLLEHNSKYKFNYEDLVTFINNKKENPYIDFYKYIIKKKNIKNSDIVSITIPFDTNLYPALTFSKMVKEYTSCNVVIGGVLINATSQAYVNHPDLFDNYFDAILTGQGEKNFVEYVENIDKKRPITQVKGAIYKKNNTIYRNSPAIIDSSTQMKEPLFKNINFDNYNCKRINLEFSKGCYWGKCVYCASSIKQYTVISAKQAVDRIEKIIAETGITSFPLLDDAVNINFAEKFADEIINRNLKINYHFYLRFEKELNADLFKKLYASGLKSIFFGLESASPKILKIMNKGINIDEIPRILKESKEAGIQNIVSFVLGFPFETEEDLLETLNFQQKNKENIAVVNNFCFTLLKGSALLEQKEKFNITNIRDVEEFSNYLLYEKTGLSNKRIHEILLEHNISIPPIFTRW